MHNSYRYLITAVIVLAAIAAVSAKYYDYIVNPWTRNAQVRANVIQVAPQVSGRIVKLPILDNRPVKAGDLLFEIDPRPFQAAVAEAQAKVDETRDELAALAQQVEAAEASVEQYRSAIKEAESQVEASKAKVKEATANISRQRRLLIAEDISQARFDKIQRNFDVEVAAQEQAEAALLSARSALSQSQAVLAQAQAQLGAPGEANPQLRAATAALETAKLNLEFTKVHASVDGHVTNLKLRIGSQAVANTPALALVDAASFWIEAYFRESEIGRIKPGNQAVVTLMSYPDAPFAGTVDSFGRGIAKEDGSTGADLLPNVNPTFEWIRLAQRIPVRIKLQDIPSGIELIVGATASVMVRTQSSSGELTPAPALLR